jgi:hypothetical protein
MRSVALLLAVACSCTTGQARTAHRAGEVALAGGLIGILADVVVAAAIPSHDNAILEVGLVFVPICLIGALTYAATDSYANQYDGAVRSEHSHSYDAAYELAREAKHAARRGDCAQVQAIEPRVRELDEVVYRKFLHDAIIKTCLAPAPPPVPAEPPATPTPPATVDPQP